jgi:hypothetical protein
MQRGFRIFSIILAIVLAIYFSWSGAGRKAPPIDVRLHIDSIYQVGTDSGKGNLVGINTYMTPQDYASVAHVKAKLDGYLQVAQLRDWLHPNTTVVFPEYIGTWLVIAGEKQSVIGAATIDDAMTRYVSSNIFSFLRNWFMAPDEASDKVTHSVFASKAEKMARMYKDIFASLASKYKVTIVAGSILLQNPAIVGQQIRIRNGPLYNVTAVFNPDGTMQPELVYKAFPIETEQPFLASKPVAGLPTYDLPTGRTSVAICADAWFPDTYQSVRNKRGRIMLVPSYTQPDASMGKAWTGYSGYPAPPGVDTTDVGKISLREAWMKYTLPGRLRTAGADYGLLVTLRGTLWNLGTDGEFIAVTPQGVYTGQPGEGASMVCVYLR